MAADSSSESFGNVAGQGELSISPHHPKKEEPQPQLGQEQKLQPRGETFQEENGVIMTTNGEGMITDEEACVALQLPKEVSRRVFSQLDYRDLVQCSLVCKQWESESTELRQGWKEELYWAACSVRGVYFTMDSAPRGLEVDLDLYLPGSPD